jgi:peptide/nickel transport system permease protein
MTVVPSLSLPFIFDILYHAMLPALSMIVVYFGYWLLTMRAMIVEALGSDHLRFAELKGLKKSVILIKYAWRNALIPQVTGLAMSLGRVVSGALLCEILFSYPGLGLAFYSAMTERDYNTMQGILVFSIILVLAANLVVDLIYPLIDPRIVMEE